MAIQAAGEFEIIMNNILMKIDTVLSERPNLRVLVMAKGQMEEAVRWVESKTKPTVPQLKAFAEAAEAIRETLKADTGLSDQLFDMLDYLEYSLR